MELRCEFPSPERPGACGKLLLVYRDGVPYVRCKKCGQDTEIPMEGVTVNNLDRLSVTA